MTGEYTTAEFERLETKEDRDPTPAPIAILVFPDGRTEPVYLPLAGHEHLFSARSMISSPASPSGCTSVTHRPIQAAPSEVPGKHRASCCNPSTGCLHASVGTTENAIQGPRQKIEALQRTVAPKQRKPVAHKQGLLKMKNLKGTRSVAEGLAPNCEAVAVNVNPGDVEPMSNW